MSDDLRIRDQWPLMKTVIVWFLLAAMLVAGLMWAGMLARPAWLSFERKAYTSSHQYIESKKTAIAAALAECALVDGAQKKALRVRIARDKALIPESEWPYGDC